MSELGLRRKKSRSPASAANTAPGFSFAVVWRSFLLWQSLSGQEVSEQRRAGHGRFCLGEEEVQQEGQKERREERKFEIVKAYESF